jgi:hypothetical protein
LPSCGTKWISKPGVAVTHTIARVKRERLIRKTIKSKAGQHFPII